MTTTSAGPPAYERRGLILTLVLIAEFMVILDATIVSVALPSIQSGLGFHTHLALQWVINTTAVRCLTVAPGQKVAAGEREPAAREPEPAAV